MAKKTKSKQRPARRTPARPARRPAAGASSPRARPARPKPAPAASSAPAPPTVVLRGDARQHLLSLSFLRDGDEFLARLETDGGQITEMKNRSLDQLLTLVAGELEDLLE
jgi:hypothetical protein